MFIAIFVHIRSQAYQHPDCWTGRCPQILPVFRECVRKNDLVYGISQSVWGQHESLQPDSQTEDYGKCFPVKHPPPELRVQYFQSDEPERMLTVFWDVIVSEWKLTCF